jgi:hypothetical protein
LYVVFDPRSVEVALQSDGKGGSNAPCREKTDGPLPKRFRSKALQPFKKEYNARSLQKRITMHSISTAYWICRRIRKPGLRRCVPGWNTRRSFARPSEDERYRFAVAMRKADTDWAEFNDAEALKRGR